MRTIKFIIYIGIAFLLLNSTYAQQDPQYTQYMYNTMSVNPAYSGSRDHMTITALHRSQWIGLEGAPQTQTLGIDTNVRDHWGIGLSVINDTWGASNEIYSDLNMAYHINTSDKGRLAIGLKAGVRFFNVDFTKGRYPQPETLLDQKVNEIFFTTGAGLYYYTNKWYIGLSVPNFMQSEYHQEINTSLDTERMHFFGILGYVFDLSQKLKFKPAVFLKAVQGAPISYDISGNFLINSKFTLGAAYRSEESASLLAGIYITKKFSAGYAYDYNFNPLHDFNNGSHEIMLKYEFLKEKSKDIKFQSPRFF